MILHSTDRQISIEVEGNVIAADRQRIAEETMAFNSKLGATCVPEKCK